MSTATTDVPIGSQTWRIGFTMLAFAGLFVLVAMRLHHLQVDQGELMSQRAERQSHQVWRIEAARGNIYDCDRSPLAVSDGTWTIIADPAYMDDRVLATVELGRILGLDRAVLRREFENPRNGRTLAKGVDDESADKIRKLNLKGINCLRQFTRRYPEKNLAAHVLGFVHSDATGGAGIEQAFDQILAGKPGSETVRVDARGMPSITDRDSKPAVPGANVQTTINSAIQRFVEQAILEQVEKSRPVNVAALVVRPSTGEILALASWPPYSPEDLRTLDSRSMRNNVLAFVYEPGSTFKPLIAGAAVAERLARWDERIYCERGVWTCRDGRSARTIHNSHMGNEMLTVTDGIAQSDNILMAKLGVRLGSERLFQWAGILGMGRRTGINLPGEDAGIVRPRSDWKMLGACLSVPMGHEISVTPLQLAMAHAAIANGGEWLPPRLIRRIYTLDDRGLQIEQPIPALPSPRRIYTPLDAAQIQEAMTHTMSDTRGTGKNLQLDGYTSAGKTGTAEKLVGGRYSKEHHVGSFVSWAPAEPGVRAELLCLVVTDDPSEGSHYGSTCAGPVVRNVLQYSLENILRVPKRTDLTAEDDDDKPGRQTSARRAR